MTDLLADLKITKTQAPKPKPDPKTLGFGEVFTDHMFLLDYDAGRGWHDPRIVPYGPLALDPAAAVLHYAQEMFEGLKTYQTVDGGVQLFRVDMNAKRTNVTNDRICIPPIDEGLYVDAIKALVRIDKDWVPDYPGTSLYIRPFIIATEPFLGVRPSHAYQFIIILSPVGPYYKEGLAPTRIFVEDEYVRAAQGGTGYSKIGGNYAMGLKSQEKAHAKGFSQVLWLDGSERKYVEEIGTSNAFFVMDGTVYTAPLEGTILPGITRDSVLTILRDRGIPVREERFTIGDVYAAADAGKLSEVFASGTAAVISPVGEMLWKDRSIIINGGEIGPLAQDLYDTITGIQSGRLEDKFGWTVRIEDCGLRIENCLVIEE
ncbi:MAG: branched-chain amino acid aminotransferase [Clostridiales Family XIII bacterium]|jgi:branched-chain amino acid aminotransferase|nr:branched-chain amino acid aminotransferase [Clostridiales Family XIII bacterium]